MLLACLVLLFQYGNGTLDLLPHVSMKRKLHLAPRTLERGSFLQILEWEVMLLPAERACNRQLFNLQRILRFANDRIDSSTNAATTNNAFREAHPCWASDKILYPARMKTRNHA
jgi:hypothetical protein